MIEISGPKEAAAQSRFLVELFLDTEGETINALQGKLVFINAVPEQINDGGSIVDLWLQRPKASGGSIDFAGIIPGGFAASSGKIFGTEFLSSAGGSMEFELADVSVLANDGKATPLRAGKNRLAIRVLPAGGQSIDKISMADETPPINIEQAIFSDPGRENGLYLIFLNARDDGSGIAGYQIMEAKPFGTWPVFSKKTEWRECENPCVLNDQTLKSDIYIRAIDRAGNYKVVFSKSKRAAWYENIFFAGIILFAAAWAAVFIKRKNEK